MLTIDSVLYYLLTVYFDNVIQGEYGTAKPFWFFLSPSYWSEKRSKKKSSDIYVSDSDPMETNSDYETMPQEFDSRIALRFDYKFLFCYKKC